VQGGYSARDVAGLLGLSVGQVRSYVREGFLAPVRGARGQLRFSFQDVVLLRAAKGLLGAEIASGRVKRALRKLKAQLPADRPLTAVAIGAEGNRIVVRDGGSRWNPESGQVLFDFNVAELAETMADVAPLRGQQDAAHWFARGCALESSDPKAAIDAYLRALEHDVEHADTHVNLGRLLHEGGRLREALAHYQLAAAARPGDPVALFNCGVALEDLGQVEEAIAAYRGAIAADRAQADAHFNLARLYERTGHHEAAARHLRAYRNLVEPQ
jgi:tetratricopeptide (TPR) repeat protein